MRGFDSLHPSLPLMVLLAVIILSPTHAKDTTSAASKPPEQMVQAIESNLMKLFGFKRRPRPDRRKVVIPDAMLEMYKSMQGGRKDEPQFANLRLPGRHTGSANTVRSFTHVESPVDNSFRTNSRFRLHFDISSIPSSEKLKAAELRLSRVPFRESEATASPDPSSTPEPASASKRRRRRRLLHVLVHDIVKPGQRRGKDGHRREPILRLVDSKVVDTTESEDILLDVMPAVERWTESSKDNHGVLVEIVPYGGATSPTDGTHVRLRRSTEGADVTWAKEQPLLFAYTDDGNGRVHRSKRAATQHQKRKHKRKDGRENCRRYPMNVDFAVVGWNDWIVAPAAYDAFFCHGDCPFPLADHLNSTNHAIVQTLVNSVNPSSVPKACCVPTALTPISMLYLDEDNKLVLKNYQDMAVLGCGCR